eukprot:COSAG06_NODE_4823_length_3927_cov_5.756792_6_plen_112_part_00
MLYKTDRFTKTGSGQTEGKLKTETCFCFGAGGWGKRELGVWLGTQRAPAWWCVESAALCLLATHSNLPRLDSHCYPFDSIRSVKILGALDQVLALGAMVGIADGLLAYLGI